MEHIRHNPAEITKLINIYRTYECLWNFKIPDYKRMDLKGEAWETLAQELECTVDEVKKKIKYLRTTYATEKKKVVRSKQAGSSYEPRLSYFNDISFLDDFIFLRRNIFNTEESDASYKVERKRKRIVGKRKILNSKVAPPQEDDIIDDDFIEDVCEYPKQSNNVEDNFGSINLERLAHNPTTIIHIINMYRKCECLWNYKNPNFKRMDVKIKAWEKLARAFECTVNEVKKKVKHLRTTFMAEKKKVETSKQAGSSYEPRLFYFKDFFFLDDLITFRRSISNIEESHASYQVEEPPAKRHTIVEKRKILQSKTTPPEEDDIIEEEFIEDDFIEDVCEYSKNTHVADNFGSIHNPATIIHLINIYRKCECLWNYKSPNYKRLDVKGKAWKKIARELKCTVKEVKKKIKHLRAAYVAEKKKVEESKQDGSSYEPRLFYFKDFCFLDDLITFRRSISNLEESDASYQVEEPPAKTQTIVVKRKILGSKATPSEEDDSIDDDFIEDVCEYPKQSNDVADNFGSIHMERLPHNPATIIHLINMYRKCECLWNYKNPNYKRMDVKGKAWNKIAQEMECTVDEVKKKIQHLRATYVAEKKKVERSKQAGSSYEPRLFYFKDFCFLDHLIIFQRSISNIEESDASSRAEKPPAKKQKIVEKRKILESKATRSEEDDIIDDDFIEDYIIDDVCEYPLQSNNVSDNFGSTNMERLKHNQDTIIHLIKKYRTFECLWNYESPNYKRKDVKGKAWDKLAKEMKCTLKEVKKKIKHLRSTYVAEKKKVERSKQAGSSYKPCLFYFKYLSFLDDFIIFRRSISNIEESDASYQVEKPPAKKQKIVEKRKILESKATPPEEDDIIDDDFIEDVCEYPIQSNNVADNFGSVNMERLTHNQATIIHLINMYRTCECLWNYKNPNYTRMDLKGKAWDKLAEEVECTVNEVKKKIKHLRTAYVAEKKKVEESKQAGSSREPRLFYFKDLSFLDDFIIFRRSISNIEESDTSYQVEEQYTKRQKIVDKRKILERKATPPEEDDMIEVDFIKDDIIEEDFIKYDIIEDDFIKDDIIEDDFIEDEIIEDKFNEDDIIEDDFIEDDSIEETCELPKANNNVADNLAKVWSAQYTELSDRQKVFVRTIFSDVLFCGCLGRLTENTVEYMQSVLRHNKQLTSPMETTFSPMFEECDVLQVSDVSEQFLTDDVTNSSYLED